MHTATAPDGYALTFNMEPSDKQNIAVFLHPGKSQQKIDGIEKYAGDHIRLRLYLIDADLPDIIDDSGPYLPESIDADLVLDFLSHPDLSHDLAELCSKQNITVICSGKKKSHSWADYPPTCCGLGKHEKFGPYGRYFGAPEFKVTLSRSNDIEGIQVIRGAPCGASWEAIKNLPGTEAGEAVRLIGLQTQFFCVADPAGWDPINGKSPVHFAGKIHAKALADAIEKAKENDPES